MFLKCIKKKGEVWDPQDKHLGKAKIIYINLVEYFKFTLCLYLNKADRNEPTAVIALSWRKR